MHCRIRGARHYDALIYGDEPAGIMTGLELKRRLNSLAHRRRPRIALVTASDLRTGLGGTIARAGLAYLDRNQVPRDLWLYLDPYAPSSALYERFLQLTHVRRIAVDPRRASQAFHRTLRREGIDLVRAAALTGVVREGDRLCAVETLGHGRIGADVFVDASLGAGLAHRAGVPFRSGLGPKGLSHESIALGWIFEVSGLSLDDLEAIERHLTHRLLDPKDDEAQSWIALWPEYRNDRRRLRHELLDAEGKPRLLQRNTHDSADQRSPALAIAFHGMEHLRPGLDEAPARLDKANIAVLPGRLSFNALLFRNSAEQNRQVLAAQGRPSIWMLTYAQPIRRFFLRNGASAVRWMPELYIRSADQIADPVDSLTASEMARGGVPRQEALGTFTYYLDFRGGLAELVPPEKPTFNFGYRHTLPRSVSNLAVLGPSSGYGGLGEGAGRIIELNISVGQGVAIAASLALARDQPLAAVDPVEVARLTPARFPPYGRPSDSIRLHLLLRSLEYFFTRFFFRQSHGYWLHYWHGTAGLLQEPAGFRWGPAGDRRLPSLRSRSRE